MRVRLQLDVAYAGERGHAVVYFFRIHGTRKQLATGVFCRPDQWDNRISNISARKHPGGKELQIDLNERLLAYERILMHAKLSGYSLAQTWQAINRPVNDGCVAVFMERMAAQMQSSGRVGNAEMYRRAAAMVRKTWGEIVWADVNYNLLHAYKVKRKADGVSDNAISVFMRTLRAAYNQAEREGLLQGLQSPWLAGLMPKKVETRKRYLTAAQLAKIVQHQPTTKREQWAQDAFLLGFYFRGMDYVDVAHLTKTNMVDGRVQYARQKTGQQLSIAVVPEAAAILKKYDAHPFLMPLLLVPMRENLPAYQSRYRNFTRALKGIGVACGIDAPLTSKVNRHTWAMLAKLEGLPKDVISEALGHAPRTITDVYLDRYPDSVIDAANDRVVGVLRAEIEILDKKRPK